MEKIKAIEEKWQERWEKARLYESDPDERKKCFVTFPFPYMSGSLHVGAGYTAGRLDTYARFMRMRGYNVLYPFAWHWTGVTIAGIAERIKRGDEKTIQVLRRKENIDDETLEKFKDPVFIAKFFMERAKEAVKRYGLGIDWRREFHTTSYNEGFSKFVQWQYFKLKERGYIRLGTHPVVWCPSCKSPTGDHDRLAGENVSPEEFTLIKFKLTDDEIYLPAGTFRPETIFGVTNIWINPEVEYVIAEVDEEKWIVSREAALKLQDQLHKVKILDRVKGSEVIGKYVKDGITGRESIILPATFVDPKIATGIVYSVPAHAPLDWLALRDLRDNEEYLRKFGLNKEVIKKIEPISIIKCEGYGEFPAIEIVNKMKIASQEDKRAEEATQIIYKEEFHTGIMKRNCGKYSGKPVNIAKEDIIKEMEERKLAIKMLDLPQPVICRCGTRCHVKIMENQYLLKYSDKDWKEKAHKALSRMKIFPEEARDLFRSYIDNYRDWAFTRTFGLGTSLPWAPQFLIETLSDSTIYMAYYTISKFVNEGKIEPSQLEPEVLDYILLGEGNVKEISRDKRIERNLLDEMRNEFEYWYPVDVRISGKDLIANHLTFYIFHHTAIFPERHWPRGISVNGFVQIEGEAMHKSKGIYVTLMEAIEKFGADTTRLTLLLAADGMDDPNWRDENARETLTALSNVVEQILRIWEEKKVDKKRMIDKWLDSETKRIIKSITDSLEGFEIRKAATEALFGFRKAFKHYQRRVKTMNKEIVEKSVERWIKALSPFVPHLAEELWKRTGHREFVATAKWPLEEMKDSDIKILEEEEYLQQVVEDCKEILKLLRGGRKVIIYTASEWKWKVYLELLEGKEIGEILSEIKPEQKDEVGKFASHMKRKIMRSKEGLRRRRMRTGILDEYAILTDNGEYIEEELQIPVEIYREEDPERYDPQDKAREAEPYRPTIFVEQKEGAQR